MPAENVCLTSDVCLAAKWPTVFLNHFQVEAHVALSGAMEIRLP